jgi:hypothetical protein
MVNPRAKCLIHPRCHALKRMADRGLNHTDLTRMIREGDWAALGENRYDIEYGEWHIAVIIRKCLIRVLTVYRE